MARTLGCVIIAQPPNAPCDTGTWASPSVGRMLRAMNLGRWPWLLLCVGWGPWGAPSAHEQAPTASAAPTQRLEARVLRVVDGDSLWVRPLGGAPLRLRLHGIDAPEICQTHGSQAREALAARLQQHTVRVNLLAKDSYDRWLARVQDADGDVGAWMVSQGHAWTTRWQRQPGPYAQQEQQARHARRGLFGVARPEEPRAFRLRHGPCHPGPAAPS